MAHTETTMGTVRVQTHEMANSENKRGYVGGDLFASLCPPVIANLKWIDKTFLCFLPFSHILAVSLFVVHYLEQTKKETKKNQ